MLSSGVVLLPLLAGIANAINITASSSGGNATSPYAYGLMFEDINHSGDGGIYAELIQNRAFQGNTEFPTSLSPWTSVGGSVLTLQNTSVPLSSALPTSVNVKSSSTFKGHKIGLSNPGWWGIDVQPQKYTGSFWAFGSYNGKYTAKLTSSTGTVFASVDLPSKSKSHTWVEYTFTLEPKKAAPNVNNTFVIEFDSGNSINFNLISLFPPTYKNRENGMRPDLMKAMADVNPSFLRIPGGNNMCVLVISLM